MNYARFFGLMPTAKVGSILKRIPTADIDQNVFIINYQWEESARFLLIKALMKIRIRIKKRITKQKLQSELLTKLYETIPKKKNPTAL